VTTCLATIDSDTANFALPPKSATLFPTSIDPHPPIPFDDTSPSQSSKWIGTPLISLRGQGRLPPSASDVAVPGQLTDNETNRQVDFGTNSFHPSASLHTLANTDINPDVAVCDTAATIPADNGSGPMVVLSSNVTIPLQNTHSCEDRDVVATNTTAGLPDAVGLSLSIPPTRTKVIATKRILVDDMTCVEPFQSAIDALKRRQTLNIGSRAFRFEASPLLEDWPWSLLSRIAVLGESVHSAGSESAGLDYYYVFSLQKQPLDVLSDLVDRYFGHIIVRSLLYKKGRVGQVAFEEDGKTFLCMAGGYKKTMEEILLSACGLL
jgi:hypothetical protein